MSDVLPESYSAATGNLCRRVRQRPVKKRRAGSSMIM
jgi:hypothetical protein